MTAQAAPLRHALRAACQPDHQQLDRAFPAPLDATGYVTLLQVLGSLHRTADPLLTAWNSQSSRGVAAAPIPRGPALLEDLAALGQAPAAPLCLDGLARRSPGILTDPAGLGLLYVTAGSSVGARVSLRALPPAIPTRARRGLTLAASPASADLWRHTLIRLSEPADAAFAAEAVQAAQWTFRQLVTHPALLATA